MVVNEDTCTTLDLDCLLLLMLRDPEKGGMSGFIYTKVFSANFHFLLIYENVFPRIFPLIRYKLAGL